METVEMATAETMNALMKQLQERLLAASDGQVGEIIQEAQDEALTEAKAIIRESLVQAILEHALRKLEDKATDAASDEQSILRREIEAIRGKIVENERLLSQLGAPAVEERESGPDDEAEEGHGIYVYGIAGCGQGQPVGDLPGKGIDPAFPVYALPHQVIRAIVSQVSLQEFGQSALEANLNDVEWLEARVRAHEQILETVLAGHTLIPMRLCTIYRGEDRVQEMLARHYDDFVDTLARLEGKREWGIKVYCDDKTMAQRVGESSDRVKTLEAEIGEKSSGAAYFLKKKLEETIAEEMERVSDECAQRSHDRLASHAEEAVVNPLQGQEITRRRETMILNGAYLVAEERLADFRAEVESLKAEYGGIGLSYEMTGPWPPYNFVTLNHEEGNGDEPIGR
jgi:hypothetical protein